MKSCLVHPDMHQQCTGTTQVPHSTRHTFQQMRVATNPSLKGVHTHQPQQRHEWLAMGVACLDGKGGRVQPGLKQVPRPATALTLGCVIGVRSLAQPITDVTTAHSDSSNSSGGLPMVVQRTDHTPIHWSGKAAWWVDSRERRNSSQASGSCPPAAAAHTKVWLMLDLPSMTHVGTTPYRAHATDNHYLARTIFRPVLAHPRQHLRAWGSSRGTMQRVHPLATPHAAGNRRVQAAAAAVRAWQLLGCTHTTVNTRYPHHRRHTHPTNRTAAPTAVVRGTASPCQATPRLPWWHGRTSPCRGTRWRRRGAEAHWPVHGRSWRASPRRAMQPGRRISAARACVATVTAACGSE